MSEPEIVETWSTVEYPILRAIVLAEQRRTQHPQQAAAEAVPGLDHGQLVTSLYALYDDKYIAADVYGGRHTITVTGAKPKA